MCTVSIFSVGSTCVLTMNRDEARDRPELGTLHSLHSAHCQAAYPVDARSGGTWLAANAHGVVLALLNRYQDPVRPNAVTRGEIIAQLIALGSMEQIEAAARNRDWSCYSPFDLLLCTASRLLRLEWDGAQSRWHEPAIGNGYLHSSSSERLPEVLAHRQTQFDQFVSTLAEPNDPAAHILSGLHLPQQPATARSDIYVSRPFTHSKSICQVVIAPDATTLRYWTEQALQQFDPTDPSLHAQEQSWSTPA